MGVREALADLRANVEPARTSVLKVNVRDARDSLRRRVNQIGPETSAIQVHTNCHQFVIAALVPIAVLILHQLCQFQGCNVSEQSTRLSTQGLLHACHLLSTSCADVE